MSRLNSILTTQEIKGRISVVIPFYGSFDSRRAICSIESIKAQNYSDLEIVVSEQGTEPKLKHFLEGVNYTFTYHAPPTEISDFNPGQIRNRAIEICTGEFIYTTDADIVFLNQQYLSQLKELMDAGSSLAFYRPPMRRLPLDNFEEFLRLSQEFGILNAMASLDRSQEFLINLDKKYRPLKVVQKMDTYMKTFTASETDHARYKADPTLKGKEPTIWFENLHCGGNFFRRSQFNHVGGYSEEFINWGREDSDLQWKIQQCFELRFIPKETVFEVMHLDHDKSYFSKEMWKRNEAMEQDRQKRGIAYCIAHDIDQIRKRVKIIDE